MSRDAHGVLSIYKDGGEWKSRRIPRKAAKKVAVLVECKSRDGITIGLADAIMTLANVLLQRVLSENRRLKRDKSDEFAWHSQPVQDALHDLQMNKALRALIYPYDEESSKIIIAATKAMKGKP